MSDVDLNKASNQVAQFYHMFGKSFPHTTPNTARGNPASGLQTDLIEEELWELRKAIMDDDIIEIADAYTDLLYLVLGGMAIHGLADKVNDLFNEVHASNLTKAVGGNIVKRDDGKILKPDTFIPPDIQTILER